MASEPFKLSAEAKVSLTFIVATLAAVQSFTDEIDGLSPQFKQVALPILERQTRESLHLLYDTVESIVNKEIDHAER